MPLLRRSRRLAGALMLGAVVLAAQARTPADEERQLERIRSERAAADAAYERTVRECAQRFVVTSCVDDARAERHAQHLRLDREQQVIDEARRQRRAEQEARARRAYELKQLQAEAHRREVEERNAERARKTNPGKPLPMPGASSPGAASAPD